MIKNAQGKKVSLFIVDDFISQREVKIAETIVDTNDSFVFDIVVNQVKLAVLCIDYSRAEFFLEPGKNCNLEFMNYPDNIDDGRNPFFDSRLDLKYHLSDGDTHSLNYLINELNFILDTFSYNNFNDIYHNKNYKSIDNIRSFLDEKYGSLENNYFLNYKKYRIAEFDELIKNKSRQKIYNEYFYEKPILANNIAYMAFLESFYDNYFPIGVKYNYLVFVEQLNKGNNLDGILDSLGRDTMLRNEVFRELVFLIGMKTMLNNELIDNPVAIIHLLEQLSTQTKFSENKKIAENIIAVYQSQQTSKLIDFSWIDLDSAVYTKQNYTNKYLYILFVKTNCNTCPAEFNVLKKIIDKTDTAKIDFVILNTDYQFAKYYHHAQNFKHVFKYYYYNGNVEWLEQMGIITFPNAILITPDSSVLYNIGLPSVLEKNKQFMKEIKK